MIAGGSVSGAVVRIGRMRRGRPFAALFIVGVALAVASAASPAQINTAGWKTHRNEKMGFEVRYPVDWHVRGVQGTGPESVLIEETPRAGKRHLAVQFWIQRQANPRGLSIEQWYADQLRAMKAEPPPTGNMAIGGRPAVRMEVAGSLGRNFQFFVALHKTDIFEITITQPSSQTQLDRMYQELISTVRFID